MPIKPNQKNRLSGQSPCAVFSGAGFGPLQARPMIDAVAISSSSSASAALPERV